MNRKLAATIAAATIALAATSCGNTNTTPAASSNKQPQITTGPDGTPTFAATDTPDPDADPATWNPVEVLKRVKGCTVSAGATVGDVDAYGSRYAQCEYDNMAKWNSGTTVTVRMITPAEYIAASTLPEQFMSTDSSVMFYSDNFVGSVDGFAATERPFGVNPATVITQLGAKRAPVNFADLASEASEVEE